MAIKRPLLCVLGIGVTLAVACGGGRTGPVGPWPTGRDRPAQKVAASEEFSFKLRDGAPPAPEPIVVAPATPLDEKATAAVIARLPAMTKGAPDEKAFALRESSKPPPRSGKTITEAFPPAKTAPPPDPTEAGPLRVLRHSPNGEVGLASNLSVTFSQPMVAVTSVGDLAKQAVPVKVSPEPPGQWRWLGAKTLVFEPSPRFPMATDYAVEIPAGIKSVNGGALARAETFRFSTPPPKLEDRLPSDGPSRRDPVFFAAFDQRIVPASVLKTVRVVGGGETIAVREATAAEIQADDAVKDQVKNTKEGRWLAFRAVKQLPADRRISVTVGPGTPSAEGPRLTKAPQEWGFKTFGALKITRHECGWGSECRPFMPFSIQLSNPIDGKRFDQGMVRVEPPLPGLKVAVYGNSMSINGRTKGQTTYKVTLAPTLQDEFGQTLEKAQTVEFEVGEARKALTAEGGSMVVLDPAGNARFSVYSINNDALSVRAYAVVPEQWEQYGAWLRRSDRDRERGREPPGKQVLSTTVDVNGEDDELTETRIDLSGALKGGLGQLILVVEPKGLQDPNNHQSVETWVQSTRIGLDAFVDPTELLGWASSLTDGKPLDGVALTLLPGKVSGTTGANGLASLALGAARGGVLIARRGADSAILPENAWGGSEGSWSRQERGSAPHWFVFDDRGMYRPGEEVKIKGWIRLIGMFEGGDVAAMRGAEGILYKLQDSRGNEVARGRADVSLLGGFDVTLKLPPTVNLGGARLTLTASIAGTRDGVQHQHTIPIQEFRRPEFEVSTAAGAGPFFFGEHADVSVSASYYAGGGLPNAEVTWNVTASPGWFTPPNRSDFTFGTWVPWWGMMHSWGPHRSDGNNKSESFRSRTDGGGKHHLRIDLGSGRPPKPMTMRATASVADVNRQAWAATQSLLVHPSSLYIGLRSPRLFVQQGEALPVEAIVTDLDGKAIPGRAITVRAVRLDFRQIAGEQVEEELDPETCKSTSTEQAVRCTFQPKEGGTFKVTATVADDKGRPNQSEITLWVAGGKTQPSRGVEAEQVTLIPDKKTYKRGDTAEILVLPPFSPAEGLLTLRRSGIVKTERFTIAGSSHTVKVPIEDAYVPNVELQIDLVGAAPRTNEAGEPDPKLTKRPAFAAGSVSLSVPPVERTLTLRVTPRDAGLEPAGQTVVDVEVKDAAGKPVSNAEVAVIVVDEAVLALSGYQLPDPVAAFYFARSGDTRDHHLRSSVILGRADDISPPSQEPSVDMASVNKAAPGGAPPPQAQPAPAASASASPMAPGMPGTDRDGVPDRPDAGPIKLRTDFNALAAFAPKVPTDNDGRVQVSVKLPDSLTRYRVMAVAVAGERQFGSAESAITARLPIMVRPSAPRFLNFGDRFELPIVVQNQTEKPVVVDVVVRTTNATLTAGAGRRVKVPANDRVEVRFPAAAARAGTARFQVGAAAGTWADAAEVALPVWTPATTEAFATYGEIDTGSITQPVAAPSDVVTEYGGLEITTSSTALQALTDAVLYLVAYPFECSEQLSSRVIAIAALKDVLAAFDAEGLPPPAQLLAAVKRDIDRLALLQNSDGGWGFWRRDSPSWPFLSIHVTHALQRAKEKGFSVPAPMLESARRYLRAIETHIPSWYGADERRTIIAYALYTRARMGDRDIPRARRMVQEVGADKLPLETAGFLLSILSGNAGADAEVAGIRKLIANRVTETAGAAHFATSYGDGGYVLLHSDRRADGILLEALIGDQPKSDVIPKIVAGLLAHRKAGRWSNTQENAFVLLALDRYFSTYEKVTPDFVARAWLGARYAGEHTFKGRTTERRHVEVPMKDVVAGGATKDLVIAKDGAGRLYYRVGMRYAPRDLRLPPSSNGFTVERVYEPVDKATDVTRGADGTWRVKAGAKVRIRLSMLAPSRRYHVALVDPLPAGLEPMNSALAVTGEIPQDPKAQASRGGSWWMGTWYEHQNLRDERVEAFTTLLWEGLHTYTYVARATTPGTFVVPPPKAEEMYHPETFGRGAGDRLIVE